MFKGEFFHAATSGAAGFYDHQIEQSARFDSASTSYLSRTLGTPSNNDIVTILALISIFIATINIVGGFMVTRRMLAMFQRS